MYHIINRFEKKQMMTWLVNALVFLFFITVLAFPKGYSYAPMTLAVIGIIYLGIYLFKFKKKLTPSKEDKWLIFAFVFYFSTFALSAIIHGDGLREIDNPSRVLLFLPLLLLFRHFPINIKVILYGIPIGSAVAGIIAIYQKFCLNLDKPFPYLMHIQAGDIAISLAMMSLAITIYWGIKKEYKLMILCLACSGLGVLASALTGARGGWVGLPIVLSIILFYSYKNLNKKFTLGISLILTILMTIIIFTPQTKVLSRINIAQQEISNYFEKDHRHTSLGARLDMWNGVFLGVQEKPIFGWGSKGYISLKKQQIEDNIMYKDTLRFNDAHNQFLDSLIKRGVIGLVGLLAITLFPLFYFINAIRKSETSENTLLCLIGIIHIVSVMCFFISQTFIAHNSGTIFYFFALTLLYNISKKK